MFELGGRSIEVIETPGHTSGGCCFLDRKERILFSGDACNGNLLCRDSINTLLGALDKIKSYESEFDRNLMAMWDMRECLSLVPWIIAS